MYIVAITGASGPVLGIRLIELLLKSGKEVLAIVSDAAWETISYEMFKSRKRFRSVKDVLSEKGSEPDFTLLKECSPGDYFSPAASGTSKNEGVIVVPCSMKTLSAIASGYADSLITRAVDVALKEERRVIIVPRETPLNLIHLENLVKVKQAGASVLIPAPGFYTFPVTIEDVVDFIVGKILNLLDIEHNLFPEWGQSPEK